MLVYGKNVAKELLKSEIDIKRIYIDENFSEKEILILI